HATFTQPRAEVVRTDPVGSRPTQGVRHGRGWHWHGARCRRPADDQPRAREPVMRLYLEGLKEIIPGQRLVAAEAIPVGQHGRAVEKRTDGQSYKDTYRNASGDAEGTELDGERDDANTARPAEANLQSPPRQLSRPRSGIAGQIRDFK